MDNEKLKRLARYCVTSGTQNTLDGTWNISYDELSHHFGVDRNDINGNAQLLADELNRQEEINDLMMIEDCIEMTYHMEHCPLCQQGGIEGALALASVLGCNISDEHEDEPTCRHMNYDEIEVKLAKHTLWLYAGEGDQAVFSNCEISNQSFIARTFPNVLFYNCKFMFSDFSDADLSFCTFENCEFIDCDMSFVKAEGTNFTGTDFCDSNLHDAHFDTCNFNRAKLSNVRGWPHLLFCCIENADVGEDDDVVNLEDCRGNETEWKVERDGAAMGMQVQ